MHSILNVNRNFEFVTFYFEHYIGTYHYVNVIRLHNICSKDSVSQIKIWQKYIMRIKGCTFMHTLSFKCHIQDLYSINA